MLADRNARAQVVLGRLVVSPLATLAVLAAAVQAGVIPATERLLLLFLLMQGATPSAMFLGVMAQMHGDTEREAIMSQLLFVLNIAAIPLFTVSRERPHCRSRCEDPLAAVAVANGCVLFPKREVLSLPVRCSRRQYGCS